MGKVIDLRKLVEELRLKDSLGRKVELYKEQWEVLSCQARFVILACNARWGKSMLAGILGLARMFIPDSRVWIVAPSYMLGEKEFRYIYNFMMDNLGMRESIVSSHYDVRSGNMDIKTAIGSVCEVKSADNPVSLLGEEVDFMILSEGANLSDEVWERYLRARLINRAGRVFVPSTPAGSGGFVNKMFTRGLDHTQGDVRSFQYTAYDCPHISAAEIEDARVNLSEEAFAEQWLGKFVNYQGLVYKEFDIQKHIIDNFVIPSHWERYRAIDYGVSNPFVCLWFAVSPDGSVYVYDEHYERNMTIRDHALVIHKMTRTDKIVLTYIDPSAGIKLDLCQYGIPCIDAENDKQLGFSRAHEYLAVDKLTKMPKLRILRRCVHVIEEFTKYSYPRARAGLNVKEEPVKEHDHTMDCIRYFLSSRPTFTGSIRTIPEGSVEWWMNNIDNKKGLDKYIGNEYNDLN